MDKWRASLKHFRLTLFFAVVVLMIMLATMCLVFFGTHLLTYIGFIEGEQVEKFPLFLFCMISVFVGTVLSIMFSRAPLRPIREIMDATDKIADGDYSVRLGIKGPEEFRTLNDKFNHMAEELASVEMLRSDFVNNFSHEFKTPIVSIRGFARALKWDDLTPEDRDEYLNIIIRESERLSDLSTNVLYLSKIEQQSILTDRRNFNLAEQIRLVIALLDQKLSEKQLEIVFDSAEVFVTGNEEMLRQVWINLLDNAVKFSPAQGEIAIQIQQTHHQTLVTVSNQGELLPQGTLSHVFEKFYQGDPSHAAKGNGLGLAIVKRIIQLHSGSVELLQSENGRTTVKVFLST